jgi:hypothetical protein
LFNCLTNVHDVSSAGPYYWVKCKPEEPIPASQPNQGSVRGRKEKKRMKQRKDFIMVNTLCILYSHYCSVELPATILCFMLSKPTLRFLMLEGKDIFDQ